MEAAPPYRTYPPIATHLLILAQVVVWVVARFYLLPADSWVELALQPKDPSLLGGIISPFLHLDPTHLGVNMAVLWLFGTNLERHIGSVRFLLLYLGAGWFASAMHWATAMTFNLYSHAGEAGAAIGASGAVAGLLGASMVRFAHPRLRLPFSVDRTFPVTPLVALWVTYTVVRAMVSTWTGASEGIGHWAHLSGFVFGLAAAQLAGWDRVARAEFLEHTAAEAAAHRDMLSAARALTALLSMRPHDIRARRELILTRLELGDRPGARRLAREGLVDWVKSGDRAQAVKAFRAYGQLVPDLDLPTGIRYRVGCWLADTGDAEAAFRCLLESVREDGASGGAASLYRAGQLAWERLSSASRARDAWERLLQQFPDSDWTDAARDGLRKLPTAS
jgi:membrane associated rhomboid family serine protease